MSCDEDNADALISGDASKGVTHCRGHVDYADARTLGFKSQLKHL